MTAAEIVAEIERRLGVGAPARATIAMTVREVIPTLTLASPGDWWAEQIILETMRVLKEKR